MQRDTASLFFSVQYKLTFGLCFAVSSVCSVIKFIKQHIQHKNTVCRIVEHIIHLDSDLIDPYFRKSCQYVQCNYAFMQCQLLLDATSYDMRCCSKNTTSLDLILEPTGWKVYWGESSMVIGKAPQHVIIYLSDRPFFVSQLISFYSAD